MLTAKTTLLAIPACLLLLITDVAAQHEAKGNLTVDSESTDIKYAYADDYDGDITVILTDAELPPEVIPDRTYDLGANGAFKGVVFSVSRETKELQSGGWYELVNAIHFHPVMNEQGNIGEPSLSLTNFGDEMMAGTISTSGPKDVAEHEISYDITFSVSLKKEPLEVTVTGADDAPSKAYAGWCKALFAGDVKAMTGYSAAELAQMIEETDAEEMAEGLEFQQMMMPTNIEIKSSAIDGDKATLEVVGKRGMEITRGTITMMKEGDSWKVGEQSWTGDETTE